MPLGAGYRRLQLSAAERRGLRVGSLCHHSAAPRSRITQIEGWPCTSSHLINAGVKAAKRGRSTKHPGIPESTGPCSGWKYSKRRSESSSSLGGVPGAGRDAPEEDWSEPELTEARRTQSEDNHTHNHTNTHIHTYTHTITHIHKITHNHTYTHS